MFVRFYCGCVGLPPKNPSTKDCDHVFIVDPCDSDLYSSRYLCAERSIRSPNEFVPLEYDEVIDLLKDLNRLAVQGEMYEDMAYLVKGMIDFTERK
jgi:hypothetical protein